MPGLFLVRHAEPAVTGVMLGSLDPPLSDAGRANAARLLRGIRWSIVYSSPLRRSAETAELIARGAPVEILDDLREISHGDWNGLTWAQVEARDPEFAARKLADWRGVTAPNAERWEDFALRVARAIERIRRGPRPAAIVAHAAVNQFIGNVNQAYGDVHELED
ncbi:MAG TPA: histidine phosphatase family protein [Bryobacteraceae bacterium]|nr:histidine phosphatase family protein [Bryobacteraceae bacterium]